MKESFLKAVEARRTFYSLSSEATTSVDELVSILESAVLNAPSAFNSQSSRVMLLKPDKHKLLWTIVLESLKVIVPPASFAETEKKIMSFMNAYATILFFEDSAVVSGLEQAYKTYAANFKPWSEQTSGMLQFIVWTALEEAGYGVSLQHYNPLIDEKVAAAFKVPSSWRLIGQMPFGKPTAAPDKKEFLPLADRLIIL